jgi:hypothetical protein
VEMTIFLNKLLPFFVLLLQVFFNLLLKKLNYTLNFSWKVIRPMGDEDGLVERVPIKYGYIFLEFLLYLFYLERK